MPSVAPQQWRPDVEKAKQDLADGQGLIVSVVGSPGKAGDGAAVSYGCQRDDMADYLKNGEMAVMIGSSLMYLQHLTANAKQQHPDW